MTKTVDDSRKLDYLISGLNMFELFGYKNLLMDNNLNVHLAEIKRLAEATYRKLPTWVQPYYRHDGQ